MVKAAKVDPPSPSPISHGPGSEAEFGRGESAAPSEIPPSLPSLILAAACKETGGGQRKGDVTARGIRTWEHGVE